MVSTPVLLAQLKQELQRRGMSVVEFSRVTGIYTNTAHRWFSDKQSPRRSNLVKACQRLGWFSDSTLFNSVRDDLKLSIKLAWEKYKQVGELNPTQTTRALYCLSASIAESLIAHQYGVAYEFKSFEAGSVMRIDVGPGKVITLALIAQQEESAQLVARVEFMNHAVFDGNLNDATVSKFSRELTRVLNHKHNV